MKKINIGIISYDYNPPIGGQGTYVIGLRKLLNQSNTYNIFILSAAKAKENNEKSLPSINNEKFGPIFFSILINILGKKWAQKNKIDTLHLQTGAGGVFWIRRKIDMQVVATSHLLYSKKYEINKGLIYRLLFWLERITYKNIDRVIATSSLMKAELISKYGLENEKITVITPNIDTDVFRPLNNLKKDSNEVLYVGRLDTNKRVDELVNIMPNIKKHIPDIKLTIIGSGPEKAQIINSINSLQISDYVKLVGFKSKEELKDYYNRASLTILPSEYEAFGLTAIESIACGTQAIAPKNSGIADLITHNQWGYVFENFNDLEKIIVFAIENPKIIEFSKIENVFSNISVLKKLQYIYS
jgi:1,2-diacylglycerol 3-alpha-glucosyltransferase